MPLRTFFWREYLKKDRGGHHMAVLTRRSRKFAVTVIVFTLCVVSSMGLGPVRGHAAIVGALDFSRGSMMEGNGNGIEAPLGAALSTARSLPLPVMSIVAGIGRVGASLNPLLTVPLIAGDPGDSVSEESGNIFGGVFLDLSWGRTVAFMQPFVMMAGDRGGGARKAMAKQVPIPAAIILFGSGLCGIVGIVVRREKPVKRQDFESGASICPSQITRSCEVFLLSSDRIFSSNLEEQLQRAGYQCRAAASSVAELLEWARHRPPALVLVDRRVTDWDILRTEQAIAHVPILTLIPHEMMETDEDIVADLERGADGVYSCRDGRKLFLAMIGAYCRRAGHDMARRGVYQLGDVQLDADTHELTIGSETIHLSAKQFAILQVFMSAPCKVFAREELIGLVWGPGFAVGEHTLDVHIHALRKLLSRDADHGCEIVAIKGVGFKLKVRYSSESAAGRNIESLSRTALAQSTQRGEFDDPLRDRRRCAEAPSEAGVTFLKRASRRNRFGTLSRSNRRPSATRCA